ncbi:MAG: non-canonical purine NTP pyrophosphatase [bacterium]|nr:MAG: non-canonical purine NTP pyrophosphatase [bacterium]
MIKKLIFGTTNEAKIKQIRGVLAPAGIEVDSVVDKSLFPEVIEDGKTANENARKKALAYAKTLGKTVFSMDNALYINGLSDDKQPALNVRRIDGRTATTDEEMIEYYSKLIESLGGKAEGYLEFGICIATPNGEYKETTIKSPRTFVSTPTTSRQSGYPLESIQIDPATNKYIADMTQQEQDTFWQQSIGEKLLEFVKSVDF